MEFMRISVGPSFWPIISDSESGPSESALFAYTVVVPKAMLVITVKRTNKERLFLFLFSYLTFL